MDKTTGKQPLAAQARALSKAGDWEQATLALRQLISEVTDVATLSLTINRDQYSLNSLNGTVALDDGRALFFKYHNEEGEDKTIEEYYNAELLHDSGFRVDVPLYACGEPGRQILLYQQRFDRRMADVCREIELNHDWVAMLPVVEAQRRADQEIWTATLPTLHESTLNQVSAEPIHQLFYHRLISEGLTPGFGGRVASFYVDKAFQLGEERLSWQSLSNLRWVINGVPYAHSLRQLFAEAAARLSPIALSHHGTLTAHGDAHNANVWYETSGERPQLVSFDPAFAGRHIPALLAEIKATFHNIFAHPLWLYEPARSAELYQVNVLRRGDTLYVDHNWQLTPLRAAFLDAKGKLYWQPLLDSLQRRGLLPANWQRLFRLAMFCCPTLVLNLRVDGGSGHTPDSSALGFAMAMMLGSEPLDNAGDNFTDWLNGLTPTAPVPHEEA